MNLLPHPALRSLGRLSARTVCALALSCLGTAAHAAEPDASAAFSKVQQIFAQRCLDCHAAQEPEAKLVLESFESLMRGGENGPAVVPGKSSDSLLVKMIEGSVERAGKKKIMPPGKREKLTASEIATVRAWIDAGAPAPKPGTVMAVALQVPKIAPKVPPRHPVHALAYSPNAKLMAVGRDNGVQLISPESHAVQKTFSSETIVNALAFSPDGKTLFAAGGEAGLSGKVDEWDVAAGTLIRSFHGHKDAVYSLAVSPNAEVLATGSYDQKIKLWDIRTGAELKTLSGHNGAVFDLAFRPDGQILASASADRTVKLWDVASGERRDTLAQALKELYAVQFSSDGKRLFAAGADNRIRVWEISEKAVETTNPLLEARFAHEGAILKLARSPGGKALLSSASDQTVKVWDAEKLEERAHLPSQPDWGSAVTFVSDKALAVGRLDGSLEFYDAESGQVLPPPKPQLVRVEPRGAQRGTTAKIKLIGSNLGDLKAVKSSDPRLTVALADAGAAVSNEREATLSSESQLPVGSYELWGISPAGESGRIKVELDDLPQAHVPQEAAEITVHQELSVLPTSVWTVHYRPGQAEEFTLHPTAGQTVVFDVAAKRLGSKAEPVLTLSDAQGKVLQNSSPESGRDALLAYTFPTTGEYRLRVSELVLSGSTDHFYRLSVGSFPYVTGCFPLSVAVGQKSEVKLLGYNLPRDCKVAIQPNEAGEVDLPVDTDKFRLRRGLKVIASDLPELVETEPNDRLDQANSITPPCAVAGQLWSTNDSADADLFQFTAKAGETWAIETAAAQRGSPADTKIEILHPDGKPVERLLLQAVRDSSVTFRGVDSDSTDCRLVNWEEMELNQYLYLQGEVVKLFRAPQGPDSGFLFYSSAGRRRCYFDTSPAAHALDEPCYIVQPHPPGTKLVSNGLPVFPLYYQNDDDGQRQLGTDSRLHFTAPADGTYLIRVTDTRGFSGERFVYRLVVRHLEPDFQVALRGTGLAVGAGSGQEFSVQAERLDGFEGEIEVSINHLPEGFSVSTPLVIEAGQTEANGTIHARLDATSATQEDWDKVQVTASATVDGRAVVKGANNFGLVKLVDRPKLFVALEPAAPGPEGSASAGHAQAAPAAAASDRPLEITLAPGQSVPAWLRVQRNGHDDLITFTVENLPHGVIVDNIGLNGVLIPKEQSERQVLLTAAKWVPDTDRLCFAVEGQAGRQTSLPVLLHIRRNPAMHAAAR